MGDPATAVRNSVSERYASKTVPLIWRTLMKHKNAVVKAWSAVLVTSALAVAACSNTSSPAPVSALMDSGQASADDGGGEPDATAVCSTGTPYTNATNFPSESSSAADNSLPQCVPHCGATPGPGGPFSVAGLPSGMCENPSYGCKMTASTTGTTCDGKPQLCFASAYRCTCAAGTWQCVVVGQGGARGPATA
jgi:hypothetical protein